MNLVENVYNIAEQFMKNPTEVRMDEATIEIIANDMLFKGPINFPIPIVEDVFKGVLLELISASINYCYWYGKSTVRPNGACSTLMYKHLDDAFSDYVYNPERNKSNFNICLKGFINLLIKNRFPLIEERIIHLIQLHYMGESFVKNIAEECDNDRYDVNEMMHALITLFPGFASDIFLKRASLFFIQLNRRFGWYKDAINNLHVPADYQVPKMLEYFGCISYSKSLKHTIESNKLIAKNSIEECEIRAATILTCKKLCEITGWTISDVDGYFFLRRNEVTGPFHLCITTDY
ncbi:MAG TPA: queuosine salvage family protein [Candidatus Glassbacteria bacterium]|nr:queuosine salvage family protein [Candidatus Glassbacteria bacterium]